MEHAPRDISDAYRRGESDLLAFFSGWGQDDAALEGAVRASAARATPAPVIEAILSASRGGQGRGDASASEGLHPAQRRHLDALAAGGASVVVTGQQVGLFGGPLYALFKAATAIRLAADLQARTGVPTAPVYWLQTEDHDLDEIDHTWVYGRREGLLRVGVDRATRRQRASPLPVSVGHRMLRGSVVDALQSAERALEGRPHAEGAMALLARCWHPEARWGEAFASWIAALLGPAGLLLLDPNDARVKRAWAPAMHRSVTCWRPLAEALRGRAAALSEQGVSPQVHVRADSPLLFAHPDGPEGPRHRLQAVGEDELRFLGDGRRIRQVELLRWIEEEPTRVSSSALLRPALQDAILPAAVTVGGPGEIAYWAQLGPIYEALEVPGSLMVPRWHARVVPSYTASVLRRLGRTPAQVLGDPEALAAARATRTLGLSADGLEARLLAALEQGMDGELGAWIQALPELEARTARSRRLLGKVARRVAGGCERALRGADEVFTERLAKAQAVLWPQGGPQERTLGAVTFAAELGWPALVERVLEAARPGWHGTDDMYLPPPDAPENPLEAPAP